MHYDVFNGDADGIFSLVRLRLSNPKNSKRITGVMRDTTLLNNNKSYLMGIRASYNNEDGDDILCSMFDGGGRRGATGINNLSKKDKNNFIKEFKNNLAQIKSC